MFAFSLAREGEWSDLIKTQVSAEPGYHDEKTAEVRTAFGKSLRDMPRSAVWRRYEKLQYMLTIA